MDLRSTGALFGALLCVSAAVWGDPWPEIAIPPENARGLTRPVPRPGPGDVEARARLLFRALQTGARDDLGAAAGFFFERLPFFAVKDMSGAAGYHATLLRSYRRDIEAYRAERPELAGAQFDRFELSRACTWMTPGREANRLPYWSCYRSKLHYRTAAGRPRELEVRVMIHWGARWFVTHLRPFH